MTSLRQPRLSAQATTSIVAETKAGAAQLALARDERLTASIIANVGNANAASRRARGPARVRGDAARTKRPAKNSGPNTANCEPKNSRKASGWNRGSSSPALSFTWT
jgi:hypothetical protein